MARKPKGKNKKKKMKPDHWDIPVDADRWKGFDKKLLQNLVNGHMTGEVRQPKKGSRQPRTACLYVSLGGASGKGLANPILFSVKICPTYPCSG